MILVRDLAPVPAAGRTIGEVRESIARAVSSLPNTQAYVSLSSVRQVGILVVGHINNPGRKNLTVFHTVLDALSAGGGIQKTGSLRKIKLVRQGRSNTVDLYDLLLHGGIMTDMRLQDGDRIIVPPVGPTVAIAGTIQTQPGGEPSARHLHTLIETIKRDHVRVIISEVQLNQKVPQLLARETGSRIAVLTTLPGGLPGTETYLDMLRYNVLQLAQALEQT